MLFSECKAIESCICCRCQALGTAIRSFGSCPPGCPVCPRHWKLLHHQEQYALCQQAMAEQQAQQQSMLYILEQQQNQQVARADLATQQVLDLLRERQNFKIAYAEHKVTESVYKERLASHFQAAREALIDCSQAEHLFISSTPDPSVRFLMQGLSFTKAALPGVMWPCPGDCSGASQM